MVPTDAMELVEKELGIAENDCECEWLSPPGYGWLTCCCVVDSGKDDVVDWGGPTYIECISGLDIELGKLPDLWCDSECGSEGCGVVAGAYGGV